MKKLFISILLTSSFLQVHAQKQEYKLGILLDYDTPIADTLLFQLKEEITKVVGEDAVILFPSGNILVHQFDAQKATTYYNQLTGSSDIIIVLGPVGEQVIKQFPRFIKPTILFGGYNTGDKVQLKDDGNLTHIVDQEILDNDLKELRKLTDFKKVGIAIEGPIAETLKLNSYFDRVTKELGVGYELIPFNNLSHINAQVAGIDAFYLAGGALAPEAEVKELAGFLNGQGIPSMTVGGLSHLNQGFLATTLPRGNHNQLIRRIALAVYSYVQEIPLGEMSFEVDYNPKLTVNLSIAGTLGISLPYSSLDDTDFIEIADRFKAEEKFTLESFLYAVLGRNLNLSGAKKEVALKGQDLQAAKSNYLPTLEATSFSEYVSPGFAEISFGQNPEFQSTTNVAFNQTLYSAQASANIEIEKNLLKAEVAKLSATELDLVLDAGNAYFNALLAKAAVNIQAGNLRLTKTNYEIAQQNFELGESNKSDLLQLKSRLAVDKQQMVTSINRLEQALVLLNQLVNNPLEKKIDVEDLNVDKGFFKGLGYDQFEYMLDNAESRNLFAQFLINESKVNSPELKSLNYMAEATRTQEKLFGAQRLLPTVGLQASYLRFIERRGEGSVVEGFEIPDDYFRAGIGISIPIFNGNRNSIARQKAIVRNAQISLNIQDATLSLETGVRNTIFEVINQMATIKLARETEGNAAEALEMIQDAYANGAVGIVQLFDVQNTYLQAQISRTQADYGYMISVMNLERIIAHFSVLSTEEANQALKDRFLTFNN